MEDEDSTIGLESSWVYLQKVPSAGLRSPRGQAWELPYVASPYLPASNCPHHLAVMIMRWPTVPVEPETYNYYRPDRMRWPVSDCAGGCRATAGENLIAFHMSDTTGVGHGQDLPPLHMCVCSK